MKNNLKIDALAPLNEEEISQFNGGEIPGFKDTPNVMGAIDTIWSFCRGVYNAISN